MSKIINLNPKKINYSHLKIKTDTYVDLMVIQRSCSSLRVSVKRASPALALAIIPALHTSESVRVDLP